ncbi:nitroreductase family protein [Anaerocolumna xylanovorans]|uniref:Nitroreductase n=1 Tax=Anaerocolumna xylanovorans DSM 12503 TaxID=1121345 RepID=A0A1M7YI75_9FIRM|nr:nitroreductase family protein [Anaerocolumna xylanovorans]SHO52320.1 Nitroreductase [Anaerocolumna xylanovorans DSM 12503]
MIHKIEAFLHISLKAIKETARFITGSSKPRDKYEMEMLIIAHALEKGMVNKDPRLGYGVEKAIRLIELMGQYLNRYGRRKYAIEESIAVLDAYIEFSNAKKVNIEKVVSGRRKLYQKYKIIPNTSEYKGGAKTYTRQELLDTGVIEPEKFFERRRSVRNFSGEKVSDKIIQRAAELAANAPSACNRQPSKIRYSETRIVNDEIGSYIAGNAGFKENISTYLVVSAKVSGYQNNEMFAWYIDGGIFTAYVMQAFFSLGIGSCIFQWEQFCKNENKIKRLLDIQSDECIIAIIAIGQYEETVKCVCAQRKSIREILIKINNKGE